MLTCLFFCIGPRWSAIKLVHMYLTLVSGIDLLTGMLFTKNSLVLPVNWVEKGTGGMRHKLGDENV